MLFVTFDVDSREGTRRTQIFAGSAANAAGLVDGRDVGRLLVVRIAGNHLDGSHRTVACTVATLHTVVDGHTVLLDEHGVTNLRGSLQFVRQGFDGTGDIFPYGEYTIEEIRCTNNQRYEILEPMKFYSMKPDPDVSSSGHPNLNVNPALAEGINLPDFINTPPVPAVVWVAG